MDVWGEGLWRSFILVAIIFLHLPNYGQAMASYYQAPIRYRQYALNATDLPCGSEVEVKAGEKFLFDSASAIVYESSQYATQSTSNSYMPTRKKRATGQERKQNPNTQDGPTNMKFHILQGQSLGEGRAYSQGSGGYSRYSGGNGASNGGGGGYSSGGGGYTSGASNGGGGYRNYSGGATNGGGGGYRNYSGASNGSGGGYRNYSGVTYGAGGGYGGEAHYGGGGGVGYGHSIKPSVCQWTFFASADCSLEMHIIRFKPGDQNCYKQEFSFSDNKTEFKLCGHRKLYPGFRAESPVLNIKYWRLPYTYRHVFKGYVTCAGRTQYPSYDGYHQYYTTETPTTKPPAQSTTVAQTNSDKKPFSHAVNEFIAKEGLSIKKPSVEKQTPAKNPQNENDQEELPLNGNNEQNQEQELATDVENDLESEYETEGETYDEQIDSEDELTLEEPTSRPQQQNLESPQEVSGADQGAAEEFTSETEETKNEKGHLTLDEKIKQFQHHGSLETTGQDHNLNGEGEDQPVFEEKKAPSKFHEHGHSQSQLSHDVENSHKSVKSHSGHQAGKKGPIVTKEISANDDAEGLAEAEADQNVQEANADKEANNEKEAESQVTFGSQNLGRSYDGIASDPYAYSSPQPYPNPFLGTQSQYYGYSYPTVVYIPGPIDPNYPYLPSPSAGYPYTIPNIEGYAGPVSPVDIPYGYKVDQRQQLNNPSYSPPVPVQPSSPYPSYQLPPPTPLPAPPPMQQSYNFDFLQQFQPLTYQPNVDSQYVGIGAPQYPIDQTRGYVIPSIEGQVKPPYTYASPPANGPVLITGYNPGQSPEKPGIPQPSAQPTNNPISIPYPQPYSNPLPPAPPPPYQIQYPAPPPNPPQQTGYDYIMSSAEDPNANFIVTCELPYPSPCTLLSITPITGQLPQSPYSSPTQQQPATYGG